MRFCQHFAQRIGADAVGNMLVASSGSVVDASLFSILVDSLDKSISALARVTSGKIAAFVVRTAWATSALVDIETLIFVLVKVESFWSNANEAANCIPALAALANTVDIDALVDVITVGVVTAAAIARSSWALFTRIAPGLAYCGTALFFCRVFREYLI